MAFDYDLEHPVLINPTHQYARQGLDNPDAVYFNAYLDAGRVVRRLRRARHHRRPVLPGDGRDLLLREARPGRWRPSTTASWTSPTTAGFEWRFGPELGLKKAAALIIREVYDDWGDEEGPSAHPDPAPRHRGAAARPALTPRTGRQEVRRGREDAWSSLINTWFAFPEWFTYKEPVNTLTVPKSTPGGLASQFSSIGHYVARPTTRR